MKHLTIFLILFCLTQNMWGQKYLWEKENIPFDSFPMGNGIQDANGNLWIISGRTIVPSHGNPGIAFFDGETWEHLNSSNSGLVSDTVYALYKDNQNNIWFSTQGGISKFDGTNWTTILHPYWKKFSSITQDINGNMWFSKNNSISMFDGNEWIYYGVHDHPVEGAIMITEIDQNNVKWIGTTEGVYEFNEDNWIHHPLPNTNGGFEDDVSVIKVDQENNIWVGTVGGKLFRFDRSSWVNFTSDDIPDFLDHVFDIEVDQEGNVWIAGQNIYKFNGQDWLTFSRNDAPFYNITNIILPSSGEKIFWGSLSEIFRLKEIYPVLTIKVAGSSLASKVAISSSKEFNEIDNQAEESLRTVEINKDDIAYFSEEMIQSFGNDIQRLDILSENNQLMGHILFEYSQEDFSGDKTIDLFMRIHTDLSTNRLDYPGWEYYSDTYVEWPTSMLIAPENSFDSIKVDQKPVLLVHGLEGSYPYWNKTIENIGETNLDIWQFYYPPDGEIQTSGTMERRAIQDLLDGNIVDQSYNSFRVSVVAHSMGGLVTRSNIQSYPSSDTRIEKFLMLGTPNNGSYSSYRFYHQKILGEIISLVRGSDNEAPAYKQMVPNSDFIHELNSSAPKNLYSNNSVNSNYLVVAGTHDFLNLHKEIINQDDGVVSVSSASLLNFNIPLLTAHMYHKHDDGQGNIKEDLPNIIKGFFAENYNFESLAQNSKITGAWKNSDDIPLKNPISNFNGNKGILTFKITGEEINGDLEISDIGNNRLQMFKKGFPSFSRDDMKKVPGTHNNFFSLNTDREEIGFDFPEADYKLIFRYYYKKIKKWMTYKIEPMPFHHLQTTMVDLDLSDGEFSILNSVNESQGGSNQPLSKAGSLHKIQENIKTYVIDGATTGAVFLINANDGENNFSQHDMKLVSPSGSEIDPSVASVDPNIEFKEDIEEGFAFYYIANPEVGTWTLQTNEEVQTITSVPVVSQATVNVSVTDGEYFTGDEIPFSVSVSHNISDLNLIVSIQKQTGLSWISIGNAPVSSVDDSLFTGNVTPQSGGTYRLQATLTGELNGENFERIDISNQFTVQQIILPEIEVAISCEDTTFYRGDTATCDITLSGDYNNPNLTLTVYQKDSLGTWKYVHEGILTPLNSFLFKGSFLASEIGEYQFRVNVTDVIDGYNLQDSDSGSFFIIPLPQIQMSISLPDSMFYQSDTLSYQTKISPNCTSPELNISLWKQNENIWDSLRTLEFNAVDDTTFWGSFLSSDTGQYKLNGILQGFVEGHFRQVKDSIFFSVLPDTITTGISSAEIPRKFALNQNYPNPFNPSTIIEYSIPHQSDVELKIFNILGQEILTLVDEMKEVGNYKVLLDMAQYPSGVYVYQIRADNFRDVKKLLLIK